MMENNFNIQVIFIVILKMIKYRVKGHLEGRAEASAKQLRWQQASSMQCSYYNECLFTNVSLSASPLGLLGERHVK